MDAITSPKIDMTILVGSSWMNVGQSGLLTIDGIWPNIFIMVRKRMNRFFVVVLGVIMIQVVLMVLD